ncbi:hypothetical protein FQZ97_904860 [compost metagenome]
MAEALVVFRLFVLVSKGVKLYPSLFVLRMALVQSVLKMTCTLTIPLVLPSLEPFKSWPLEAFVSSLSCKEERIWCLQVTGTAGIETPTLAKFQTIDLPLLFQSQ